MDVQDGRDGVLVVATLVIPLTSSDYDVSRHLHHFFRARNRNS